MPDALLTTATKWSAHATRALLRSFADQQPDTPAYVIAPDDVDLGPNVEFSRISLTSIESRRGLLIAELWDSTDQMAAALPFALERVLEDHESALYVEAGMIAAAPTVEIDELLADHAGVVVSQTRVADPSSKVPLLGQLFDYPFSISHRVFAARRGAMAFVRQWQEAVRELYMDLEQRSAFAIVEPILHGLLQEEGTAIASSRSLLAWNDFAAVRSGRLAGPEASFITADEMWRMARERRTGRYQEEDVAWGLVFGKVHDSRPLEAISAYLDEAIDVLDIPRSEETLFSTATKEIRRSTDPLGNRWGPGDHSAFVDWLYETDGNGLTRIAHLVWRRWDELSVQVPDPRKDVRPLKEWNDRKAREAYGFDLFRQVEPVEAKGLQPTRQEALINAVKWRMTEIRRLLPGQSERSARRHMGSGRPWYAGTREPTRKEAPPRSRFGRSPRSLSIFGGFRSESGLGQASRSTVAALNSLGYQYSYIDVSDNYPSRNATDPGTGGSPFGAFGDVNIIHSNAEEIVFWQDGAYRNRLSGRYNVAMWFWETADLPVRMRPALSYIDELWVASDYLADVFGQYGAFPVRVVGLAAELPEARTPDRAAHGIAEGEFTFLFVYDALSAHGRKNPEKVVEAFVKAFEPGFEDVRLIIKVSNLAKFPKSEILLQEYADRYPSITLIAEYYTRDQVLDLMAAADIYVSLHSSEGLGLTLLEAMALGTPTICTAYSGNMDFTTSDNSWLVDYELAKTTDETGPYPKGSLWASPNVDAAAALMRHTRDNPAEVSKKSELAVADAREAASLAAYAQRLDTELHRIL